MPSAQPEAPARTGAAVAAMPPAADPAVGARAAAAAGAQLGPVRLWRLHLGAHKTATTHMQGLFALRRDAYAAGGVDPIPLAPLRALRLPGPSRRDWRVWLGGAALRRGALAALAPLRRGPDVVLLSDEDFLGWTGDAIAAPAYPNAAARLRALRAMTATAERRLFLATRGWDGLLPSAYVQTLRWAPAPGGFAAFKARFDARPPSWAELAARLRALFPDAPLTVWRYEDYAAHGPAILSAVSGVDPGPGPALPPPARTRSPAAAAVAQAERLDAAGPSDQRRAAVRALFDADAAASGPAFAPLSQAERDVLREAYARDLARLAALDGVTLMRFD